MKKVQQARSNKLVAHIRGDLGRPKNNESTEELVRQALESGTVQITKCPTAIKKPDMRKRPRGY